MVYFSQQLFRREWISSVSKQTTVAANGRLTRQQLKELETKEMTPLQKFL